MKDNHLLQEFVNSIHYPSLCINDTLQVEVVNGQFAKLYGSINFDKNSRLFDFFHLARFTDKTPTTLSELQSEAFSDQTSDQLALITIQQELISVSCRLSPIKITALSDYHLISVQQLNQTSTDTIFQLYRTVFNKVDLGLFISNYDSEGKGKHGQFFEVNDVACEQLDYTRSELLNLNARTLNPEGNTEAIKAIGRNLKRDGLARFHAIHVGKNGKHNSVNVTAKLIFVENESYVLSICNYKDQAYTSHDLEQSRFGRLLELSWDEIYVFNTESLLVNQANTGALDNLGYSRYEISQLKITDLMQDISESTFKRLTQSLFEGNRSQVVLESVFKRKDNTQYPIEIRIQLSHTETPPVYLANVQNITKRKENETDLLYLANHDPLTGLFNRNMFIKKLEEALEQCNRSESLVAILFLDLDGFKYINDTMGHDTGDKLIQETAKRLEYSVRTTDIVSRLGGDEFTAILTNIKHTKDIIAIAEKIISTISEPCIINENNIQTTCSLGITVYPFTDNDNAYTLIKQADTAMYQAKGMGKNTYSFYAAALAQEERNLRQLEDDLIKAFNENEFQVYFQSKVNLETRLVKGAEALIRWPNSIYPTISPADFIPILESSDLIKDLDLWVLKETCRHLKNWLSISPELVVSINLSAKHFLSIDSLNKIKDIMKETGIPANNLEIEITEGVLISKTSKAEMILKELKDLGFYISLDDFGSGYSSLSYLKQLPIDKLKIDRTFVVDIENNKDSHAIIEAIINMADSMGLETIAEGIENEKQVNILTELKCYDGQGYLFSKPCPAEAFEQILKTS